MLERYSTWDMIVGDLIYLGQAILGIWGLYCVTSVWLRLQGRKFKNEPEQSEFLEGIDQHLRRGDFNQAAEICADDRRVLPQLLALGLHHRNEGVQVASEVVMVRYQRDLLADLGRRMRWTGHVIKIAPMLGLFGTVVGMMAAFEKLATADKVNAAELASNISLALVTTAIGLATSMPLMIAMASAGEKLTDMEEMTSLGLTHFFKSLKSALARTGATPSPARSRSMAAT